MLHPITTTNKHVVVLLMDAALDICEDFKCSELKANLMNFHIQHPPPPPPPPPKKKKNDNYNVIKMY